VLHNHRAGRVGRQAAHHVFNGLGAAGGGANGQNLVGGGNLDALGRLFLLTWLEVVQVGAGPERMACSNTGSMDSME
jgi:hypothetical protein